DVAPVVRPLPTLYEMRQVVLGSSPQPDCDARGGLPFGLQQGPPLCVHAERKKALKILNGLTRAGFLQPPAHLSLLDVVRDSNHRDAHDRRHRGLAIFHFHFEVCMDSGPFIRSTILRSLLEADRERTGYGEAPPSIPKTPP